MKAAFAIVFGLLLVWMQAVATVGASPVAATKCVGCACKQMSCCAQPASGSQPAPAAPARSLSQTQPTLLLTAVAKLLDLPQLSAPSFSAHVSPPASITAVPLYEWNCSYLI